jgi:hypothetical protein
MTSPGRRLGLCRQTVKVLTGIDFVQVVDPATQVRLRVFFVVEPDLTVPPLIAPAQVPPLVSGIDEGPPAAATAALGVRVERAADGAAQAIAAHRWRRVRGTTDTRVALEIDMAAPGGFGPHRLVLTHPRLDPLSATMLFDFKQGCPTGFDCEEKPACVGDPPVDVDIDYLARDFDSLRGALLDFAAVRYPHWREPIEADFGTMMLEIMAAQGDHFAYRQDRYDAEARFASATQRASVAAHAKLVDYRPFRGRAASGSAVITAKPTAAAVLPQDARFWSRVGGSAPVTFSTLEPLWLHPFWNSFPAHDADGQAGCVPRGATSLMLVSSPAVAAQTPAGVTRDGFLIGKQVMILSDPGGAEWPRRAIPVTIRRIEEFTDPLPGPGGGPTFVTRIFWDAAEATAFELPYDGLTVAMNLVQVAAGERIDEHFRVGEADDLAAYHVGADATVLARMAALPPAIEREGPLSRDGDGRDVIYRHGLTATEAASLRHLPDGLPDVSVLEVAPPAGAAPPLPVDDAALFGGFMPVPGAAWTYVDDLLSSDLDSEAYTLEPGMWRTVERHQLPVGDFEFRDYAGDSGWTLRFGSGDFGRAPTAGAVLRVTYRTDPGVVADIPSFALGMSPPPGVTPDARVDLLVAEVVNPLPMTGAAAEESIAAVKIAAPQAFRANPRRAVRPEDYRSILGRLPFVQRANATTRWTGSWSTDFVAVDPTGSIALTAPESDMVERELDCIRLATRDVRRVEADYLDIDIDISLCIAAQAYPGEVIEQVRTVLRREHFAPDRFTFGTPLVRSELEARVQAVKGVRFVDAIRIRVRGIGGWRPFAEEVLRPAPDQILRLQDDPDGAAMGILTVHSDRTPAGGA